MHKLGIGLSKEQKIEIVKKYGNNCICNSCLDNSVNEILKIKQLIIDTIKEEFK